MFVYCTVLYCDVMFVYCTVLWCDVCVLYCTVLYCDVMFVYCTVLYCTVLYCTVLWWLLIARGENRPWLISRHSSCICIEWVRKRWRIVSVLCYMKCSLGCCHSVIIRSFTQLFTVAIIYTDDVFRLKVTRIFIWCVVFTVVVLTCFVICGFCNVFFL
jgi:hypothetical protein